MTVDTAGIQAAMESLSAVRDHLKGGIETAIIIRSAVDPSFEQTVDNIKKHVSKVKRYFTDVRDAVSSADTTGNKVVAGIVAASAATQKLTGDTIGFAQKTAGEMKKIAGAIKKHLGDACKKAWDYLKTLNENHSAASNAIRDRTGATGEDLEALMGDMESIYSSIPTTMEDAGKAVGGFHDSLGLTGPELQEISTQALQVSKLLGDDLESVVDASGEALSKWGMDAGAMGDGMDYVYRVSKTTGAGFTDLMGNLDKFGPAMQEMGLSFEQSAALLGQLDQAGVEAGDVMEHLQAAVADMAAEGLSAGDGLQQYIQSIEEAETAAEAAELATRLFGSSAGSSMASAVRDGKLSVAELTQALEDNSVTIGVAAEDTYSFSDRLQTMKQGMEVALAPLANTIFDTLSEIMPTLQGMLERLMPTFQSAVDACMPFVTQFLETMASVLEAVAPMLASLAEKLLPPIMDLIGALLPLLEPIGQILEVIVGWIAKLAGWLTDRVTGVISFFTGSGGGSISLEATDVTGLARGGFTSGLAVAGEDPRYPVEAVISFNPAFLRQNLGYWARAGEKLGVGGVVAELRQNGALPAFAGGGFTSGLSIAGEDAGYPVEAVISFNPAFRQQNLTHWAQAGRMLGISDYDSGDVLYDGGGSSSVIYDLGGVTFAPQVTVQGDGNGEDIMHKIRSMEPEFADYLETMLRRMEAGKYAAGKRLF